MTSEGEKDPHLRVVDRRWWARGDSSSPDESGSRKPTYVEELEQRLADLAAQLQTITTEHRRTLEEFEGVRARMRREAAREVERGRRAVLGELLDVVDNLDRAIAAFHEPAGSSASPSTSSTSGAVDSLARGVELVRDQFLDRLEAFGVSRVPALGRPFDALRHEAVTTAPVQHPTQDGMVLAVVKEGYAIGDEVLRPASVVVGQHAGQA